MKQVFSCKKNIIIIKNNLDCHDKLIKKKDVDFNFYNTDFEKFESVLKKIKIKEKENNLIVVESSFYTDDVKNKIKESCLKILNINWPHILFLSFKDFTPDEKIKIINAQNFLFKLCNAISEDNSPLMYVYIVIFQHIEDLKRLNNYIIHSFQTIVDSELIVHQKIKIEKLYAQLESLSKIDVLTNVLNRRAFFEAMEKEKSRTLRDIWRLERINRPESMPLPEQFKKLVKEEIDSEPSGTFLDHYGRFACLMMDIDFFKKINDNHGHLAGDEVLRCIGELLNSNKIFRENDIIGRYGGEEFIIILPETNAEHAKIPANRLRYHIKKLDFIAKGKSFKVSVSIGLSEFKLADKKSEDIILRADKALYYAKENGRDQVVVYSDIFGKEEK